MISALFMANSGVRQMHWGSYSCYRQDEPSGVFSVRLFSLRGKSESLGFGVAGGVLCDIVHLTAVEHSTERVRGRTLDRV